MARKKAKKSTGRKKVSKAKVKKTVKKRAKKKVAKKATKVKKAAKLKLTSRSKALTRTQQIAYLAESTGLAKKEVGLVFEHMISLIGAHLKGPGEISLGGLMKILVKRKPATKARKGINPFTGEPTIFKAKPARNIIKIRPLKKVKDLV